MILRATFPVFRSRKRKLKDNLIDHGVAEEYLVSKDDNNRDLRAIRPEKCFKNEEFSTLCEGEIDVNKCTACLACQIGVAKYHDHVDEYGIPAQKGCYSYADLAKLFFNGNYACYPSMHNSVRPMIKRFDEYTGNLDERNFTNPLIACYVWELADGKAFVSCSPNHELSLDVSLLSGEREGHLDVTLRTFLRDERFLFVGEGKKNVAALLNDSSREQQKKYEKHIREIASSLEFNVLFSYVVGGNEEAMYPSTVKGVPNYIYRNKFFHDVLNRKKRFVSLHALRGLGVLHIASSGKVCLESTLFPLFENEEVYGLVLGGPVLYENNRFVLGRLDDFVPIH